MVNLQKLLLKLYWIFITIDFDFMVLVKYNDLLLTLKSILLSNGFSDSGADKCSEIFAENTLVGVHSHGVNRFKLFVQLVKDGNINPLANPSLIKNFNGFEQWDANLGPGPLNADKMTDRVMELSDEYTIGCVALRNSNHWMRAGYYAWKAAERGNIFICWTNTIPIMPPWGGKSPTTGNNPIVFGVPRKEGNVVLDMALSQFSYGQLANHARTKTELPFEGGYDKNGELSKNAKHILDTHRTLPIGLWKGSGLSLLLDMIATILSGGKSTFDLGKDNVDSAMSQVFIAIDPSKFSSKEIIEKSVNEILNFYRSSESLDESKISYPGERIIKNREKYLKNGIPVDEKIWNDIIKLRGEN